MSEIVYDSEGNAFELRLQRHASASSSGMFGGGSSLRSALGRATSTRSIVEEASNREALVRALVTLGDCTEGEAPSLPMDEVRARARQAFASQSITLVPHTRDLRPICDVFTLPTESLADELPPPEEEMRASHTLELELVDEDDEPVPGEPYRVELPGGRVVEGRLNAQGRAMLTGIEDSGNCKVTFPKLDEAVWQPA